MVKYLKLKKIISIVLVSLSVNILSGCTSIQGNANNNFKIDLTGAKNGNSSDNVRVLDYNEVKDSVIRFHCIANSDSEEDQNLKIKIKNKVIDYLYPYLNASESLDQSRQILKDKMEDVEKLAEQVVKDNNYKYNIKVQLSRENFPDKSYGNITLPQGNYEAFRIIIGSGQGRNWWCVMFPPLCFVDETKAQVEYDKTEDKIKAKENGINLDESETNKQEDTSEDNVKVKFKIVEIFKELFN